MSSAFRYCQEEAYNVAERSVKLVFKNSYLTKINDGFLNPFEIRINMYTKNTNKFVYEIIAREILASGNNRVLTFHPDINNPYINNFVNDTKFKRVFKHIQQTEFPLIKQYRQIHMITLKTSTNHKYRTLILNLFNKASDNEIIIVSSCETNCEGLDTLNTNLCVLIDTKLCN